MEKDRTGFKTHKEPHPSELMDAGVRISHTLCTLAISH